MSEYLKRLDRKLAYEGNVLKVYQDRVLLPDGKETYYDYVHHNGAAAVVPVTEDGRILMVKQYRNALDRYTLEVPAGKKDSAEEPALECAKRELEEETGYRSEQFEWLISVRTWIAFCNEKIDIYVARNLIRTQQHLDEDEFIDVAAYTLEELKEKIFAGEIEDSKTIAALLAYAQKYQA